jgi:hypothetical protein
VFTPAAKQTAVVGHEAERRRLVPAGGVSFVQERPPEIVLMMVEPAPVLPLLPTATQFSKVEHEMPAVSTSLDGGVRDVHVLPSLFVSITYGMLLRVDPTAMHVAVLGHAISANFDPVGIEDVAVQSLKSLVVMLVVSPLVASPTATQLREAAHETADRTNSEGSEVIVLQVTPASCVPIIAATESTNPTATHVSEAGQETLARESRCIGEGWTVHVEPFSVPTIPRPPTAVH